MTVPGATRACVREVAVVTGRLVVVVQEVVPPWRCLALPVAEHEANAVLAAVPRSRPAGPGTSVRLVAEGPRLRAESDGWGVDAVHGLVLAVETAAPVLVEEPVVEEYGVDVESLTTLAAVDHAVVRELLEAQDAVLRVALYDDAAAPGPRASRPEEVPTHRDRAVGLLMYGFGLTAAAAGWLLSTAAERSGTTTDAMAGQVLAAGDGALDDGARARLVGLMVSTVGAEVGFARVSTHPGQGTDQRLTTALPALGSCC